MVWVAPLTFALGLAQLPQQAALPAATAAAAAFGSEGCRCELWRLSAGGAALRELRLV